MSSIILIIMIVILLFLLTNLICCSCVEKFKPLDNKTKYDLGYAKNSDPYTKPYVLQKFISDEHRYAIMDHCQNKLFDSEVVGGKHTNIRNSQQCWIPKNDPLAKPLFEKVSKMFNIPMENAEDLQVVRYQPNQYYNEHHDSCCDNDEKCIDFVKRGGQRKITVLIYLNNDFGEGQTYFRNLDLKVKPPAGDAIVFFPLADNSNKCHPLALHAGLPVTSGEKWVANLWFRERKFT